jgi:hypothetical protein
VSGVEGVSAEGEIAVAEEPTHLEPLTAAENAEDEVDGEELGERRPKIGRRPYIPTKAEVDEHNPFTFTTEHGAHIALRADRYRGSTGGRLHMRSQWESL